MHAFTFEVQIKNEPLTGLFVDRPGHIDINRLAEELYTTYRNDLTVVSFVVVRPRVDQPLAPGRVLEDTRSLLERVPHIPIYFLGSHDFDHHLSDNINLTISERLDGDDRRAIIDAIRNHELRHYALDAGALLSATGSSVFRAPSQKYHKTFLRVGSVQIHRAALDGFFFWLLPWLKGCQAIVTETWTISSIALNTGRLLARYEPDQHGLCKIDMLSEYHDGTSELVPDTHAILERVCNGGDKDVLILVSSCSSGNLVNRLQETIEHSGLPIHRFKFRALYSLSKDHNIPALCDVSDGLGGYTFECVPEPQVDETVIEIDRRSYFPLRITESLVPILVCNVRLNKEIFTSYKGTGLFCVHQDSFVYTGQNSQRIRHHGIFTDVLAILNHSRFGERLRARLARIDVPPSLIITPPHSAGLALAESAARYFRVARSVDIPILQHLDLNVPPGLQGEVANKIRELSLFRSDQSILIIDDVSISGRRLIRFQASLRNLNYFGRIHYLVGIARPQRRAEWEMRMRELRFRRPQGSPQHTVDCVEIVVLPDWDENKCPWCLELQLYRRLSRVESLPNELFTRSSLLQEATNFGRSRNGIFFRLPADNPLNLTVGSIFLDVPADEIDVFAAVASTLQEMRDRDTPDNITSTYPECRIIDPDNYLGNHFSDSLLRASIIRAAQRCELERPTDLGERERIGKVCEIMFNASKDTHNLNCELLLGMALKKLPK